MRCTKCSIIFIFIFYFASVYGQDSVSFPVKLDPTGFQGVFVRVGNLYISGQPDEESILELKSEGVTTIINLRTPKEMDDRERVPFDEKTLIDSLSMNYVHIPLGGDDYPYTPEALTKFANAMADADGSVLLHCTVGWRASQMWAAYLIQYKNFAPDEAIEYARAVNFGKWPMEELLGKKLKVEFQ
jgi:uncharacterized protein (TIGR01244 family)